MDVTNTAREKPRDLAEGKPKCEKVFERAIAKHQIPGRTKEQQRLVDGEGVRWWRVGGGWLDGI